MLTLERTVERERVANGCAWLDEHKPGWRGLINADRLNIDDPCNCILGQLYGDFYKAVKEQGIGYSNVDRLGFDGDKDFALTRAWKEELNAP